MNIGNNKVTSALLAIRTNKSKPGEIFEKNDDLGEHLAP